jgi:hypothetical protein
LEKTAEKVPNLGKREVDKSVSFITLNELALFSG